MESLRNLFFFFFFVWQRFFLVYFLFSIVDCLVIALLLPLTLLAPPVNIFF
jgi:hypothetical protein